MPVITSQKVTFSAPNIADVVVALASQPTQITSGYGGWSVVNRPRRKGLTQWDGKDPLRMGIPVLFDGWFSSQGQEVPISRLSRMGLPPRDGEEPPVITVDGVAIPDPGPKRWVIENLQWGTDVLWETVGGVTVRLRQDCTVFLLEYVAPDREAFRSLPGLSISSGKGKVPTRITVKKGQTLQQIAAQVYGSASQWKKIAKANKLRDTKLKAGQVLRIP